MSDIFKPPYLIEGENQNSIQAALENQIGKTVCVSYVVDREALRNNFETQISVQSILEGCVGSTRFRVLVDDNTYSYFYTENVWLMGHDVNTRPVIFIA